MAAQDVLDDISSILPLALSQPNEALAIAQRLLLDQADHLVASYAHQAAGIVYRDSGQMSSAVIEMRAAVRCARSTGSDLRIADVLATYGATLAMAGQTREGLLRLDKAMLLAHGAVLPRVRLRRAHVLGMLGRHSEALAELQRAIQATRRSGDRVWEARSLNNRCLVHLALGALNRAEADAIKAGQLFAEVGQQLESVQAMHNRALIELGRGNLPAALSILDSAADRYRELEVGVPDLELDRARTLLAAGLTGEALSCLEQALEATDIQPTKHAELSLAAATASLAVGDTGQALAMADRAAKLFRQQHRGRWEAQARFVTVQAEHANGRRDRKLLAAASALAATLADLRAEEAPSAYLLTGQIALAVGDLEAAQQALSAAGRYRLSGPPLSRASGWLALAIAADGSARSRELLSACGHGLDALDQHRLFFGAELRARSSQHGREFAARALAESLRRGHNRDLLMWTERCRATAVAVPALGPPDDTGLANDLAAYRDTVRRINDARVNGTLTSGLQRERNEREAAVLLRRRHEKGDASSPQRFDLNSLVKALGSARMLVLVEIDNILHALLVNKGRVSRHPVGPMADALREVKIARFALKRMALGRPADPRPFGAALEKVLLGRLGRASEEPVILVPPSSLHHVPWGLLPSLAEVPLTVAPSAGMWLRASRRAVPQDRKVALVVGPGLSTGDEEAVHVGRLHQQPGILTGTAATVPKSLAALDGAWLGHIAAHGTFRSDSPLFSALHLYDGPLTVHDLEQLRRPPHTVLLSACETAMSAPVGADEVLGLVSGLLGLGVAAVLASVVPVNDAATVPLMLAVHTALRSGESLPEAWLSARLVARGDHMASAVAGSFTSWGA